MSQQPRCNDDFNPAERRALRKMLAWFRSAADSSSDDETGGGTRQSPIPPSNSSEGTSTVWEVVDESCYTYTQGVASTETTTAATTATGGDLLRMGDGKCIHKATCHHAKRQMSTPNCLCICRACVDTIARDKEYYMDWEDIIHDNTECKQFVGRQSRSRAGTTTINIVKKILSPCSQCFWVGVHEWKIK